MPIHILKKHTKHIPADYIAKPTPNFNNDKNIGIRIITQTDTDKKYLIYNPKKYIGKETIYYQTLILGAKQLQAKSIALPLLSSQSNLLSTINTINSLLEDDDLEVYLLLNKEDIKIPNDYEKDIKEYLQEHGISLEKKPKIYKKRTLEKIKPTAYGETSIIQAQEEQADRIEKREPHIPLKDFVEDESFNECLKRLIREKDLTEKIVYQNSNLTKQAFNGIYNDKKTPKKGNALALAIGLKLNIKETQEFIEKAGYSFGRTKQDYIVRYFIENGIYDIFEINCFLIKYDLPYLGSRYE